MWQKFKAMGETKDELDAILDGVDEGLARQLRDLKTFIGGMNTMYGAALSVATVMRGVQSSKRRQTGYEELAVKLEEQHKSLKEDMVRGLASFLAREVQQPIMKALQQSKELRAQVKLRAQSYRDYEAGKKNFDQGKLTDQDLEKTSKQFKQLDAETKDAVDEIFTFSATMNGRCIGAFVSCQKMMAQETAKFPDGGEDGDLLGALSTSFPRGLERGTPTSREHSRESSPLRDSPSPPTLGQGRPNGASVAAPAPVAKAPLSQPTRTPPPSIPVDTRSHAPTFEAAVVPEPEPAPSLDIFGEAAPSPSNANVAAQPPTKQAAPAEAQNLDIFEIFSSPSPPANTQPVAPALAVPATSQSSVGSLLDEFVGVAPPQHTPAVAAKPTTGAVDLFGFGSFGSSVGASDSTTPDSPVSRGLQRHRDRIAMEDQLKKEKEMFEKDIMMDVQRWAGEDWNPNNIRILLQTFHSIWTPGLDKTMSRWTKPQLHDLLTSDQVKSKFRRAITKVHPDKQRDKPPAIILLAEQIFERLNKEYERIDTSDSTSSAVPVTLETADAVDPSWGQQSNNN